jgi:hypothetical protein
LQAVFFPTVQEKTGLTSFPNLSDRFRPVGCRERFLSKKVFVFLVFGEFLDKISLTGLPNRSDRFAKPV